MQGLLRADELLYEAKNSGRNQIKIDEQAATPVQD
jgi:PleD family two-component response regulator